jgi:hypothetical protein
MVPLERSGWTPENVRNSGEMVAMSYRGSRE